ncbi:MAG: anti-sigma factor family protein [Gemmataceae bacterium]
MLTPEELELLTAYVDGELSNRQRHDVTVLLQRSDEARAMHELLLSDSRELRRAPAVLAPFDFSPDVLDAIAAQPSRRTPARPVTPYSGYAAAAAVLLSVGVGSFLIHRPGQPPERPAGTAVARKTPDPARPEAVAKVEPEPTPPDRVDSSPMVRVVPVEEPEEPPAPAPEPREGPKPATPVLASGHREVANQLERVEFTLPRVHVFHGLDVPEQGNALREQFALGTAYRIEIPARDAGRGLERLRATLAAHRATLTYTPDAQFRVKKAVRSDYAVYLENVAPEDLWHGLRAAGLADKAAAQKRSTDLCFEGPLVVRELCRFDRRELKDLLGIDPLEARPASANPAPPAQRGASAGVVLSLPALRVKPAELKKFTESRPPARPGTLQVLIVLRNVG